MADMDESESNHSVEASPTTSPADSGNNDGLEDHPVWGFMSAFLFALVIFMACLVFTMGTSLGAPLFIGFNACGPVAGVFLWWRFRESRPRFARGALAFGIVAFVVLSTCWIGTRGMPIHPPENWHE